MDQHRTIKGLVFDFDGTIFDLEVDWASLNQALEQLFHISSLTDLGDLPSNKKRQVLSTIKTAELAGVEQGKALPHALTVLTKLSDIYKLAIFSHNCHQTVQAGLNKIGYTRHIPIVGREDVEKHKPHPAALQQISQLLDLPVDQIIVVGDTLYDVEAARALTIPAIVVRNKKLKFTPEGADLYINNLLELDNAIHKITGSTNA